MNKIEIVKAMWSELYKENSEIALTIDHYFHPNYQQCINGEILSKSEYIQHVISQKKNIKISSIEYLEFLEEGDKLFALYCPKGYTHSGDAIEAEVISYFLFQGQKIIKIHGQVRLIKGKFSDVDMEKNK